MPVKKINDLGEITISEKAIEEVAGYAATHCYGVVGMREKNPTEAIKKFFKASSWLRHGIKATVKENEICVDIHIKVSYGVNLKVLSENVKQDIAYAISKMTKNKIKEINVYVDDIIVNK